MYTASFFLQNIAVTVYTVKRIHVSAFLARCCYPVHICMRTRLCIRLCVCVCVCVHVCVCVWPKCLFAQLPVKCLWKEYILLTHPLICCQRCLLDLSSHAESAILLISIHVIVHQSLIRRIFQNIMVKKTSPVVNKTWNGTEWKKLIKHGTELLSQHKARLRTHGPQSYTHANCSCTPARRERLADS